MKKKSGRKPILKRLEHNITLVTACFTIVSALLAIICFFLINIFNIVYTSYEVMERLHGTVEDKIEMADLYFDLYAKYIDSFEVYIDELYNDPNNYGKIVPNAPDEDYWERNQLIRYYADESVVKSDVYNEMTLLGNVVDIWRPVYDSGEEMITRMYLGTESGFAIEYNKNRVLRENGTSDEYYNYFESQWYSKAKEAGHLIYTDVYYDDYSKTKMLTCAKPFYNEKDEFAGVVALDMNVDDIYKTIVDIHMEEGSFAFLLDSSGNAIANEEYEHPDNIYDMDFLPAETVEEIMNFQIGEYVDEDGSLYLYSPLTDFDFEYVAFVDEENWSVDAAVVLIIGLVIGAMYVVGLLILGIFIKIMIRKRAKRLIGPIIALKEDIQVISEGNLDYRAKVYDDDEIGDVAKSFNEMADSLKKHITELTEYTAQESHLKTELEISKNLQTALLPVGYPAFPDRKEIDIYGIMTPAREIGGDFYDYFFKDEDHMVVMIADVSGKGIPAAMFMVVSRMMLGNISKVGGSPSEIFNFTNNELSARNEESMFVTVWLGILNVRTGHLVCANAGHEYPIIKKKDGQYELIHDEHNIVLGVFENIEYSQYEMDLEPGDSICLYTDGVPEAVNVDDKQYGLERFLNMLNSVGNTDAKSTVESIYNDLEEYTKGVDQFDDITMLMLNYNGNT